MNDTAAASANSIRKGIDDILFRSHNNMASAASNNHHQTDFYPTAAHQNLARSGLSISEQDAHKSISGIPEDGSSRGKIIM
jgi:hypothetical protein